MVPWGRVERLLCKTCREFVVGLSAGGEVGQRACKPCEETGQQLRREHMRFFSSGNQAKSPGAPSLQSPCVMLAGGLTLPGDGPVPTQGLSPLGANPALLLPSDTFGSGAAVAARQDPVPLVLATQRRLLGALLLASEWS